MSIATLVIGWSGSGKSAAMRNMDPANTLVIQALRKPLPFKPGPGWGYLTENRNGNMLVSDQVPAIIAMMQRTQRDIIVIDDWQYILTNEFMRRSAETGYQKFTEIGRAAWDLLMAASSLAPTKRVYLLAHATSDEQTGHVHVKTIGRLLDEKIVVEGMLTVVLRTVVHDGKYHFSTQTNGSDTVKSPMGMFADALIDNDLKVVDETICRFYDIKVEA